MKIIKGNLLGKALDGDFDVIVHGCNCFCAMGGGIAREIRERFPEAEAADNQTQVGDASKLGRYTQAQIVRGVSFTIVNAYTQFTPACHEQRTVDYRAVKEAFAKIAHDFPGKRIAYPMIGAGLAKGDWNVIKGIIRRQLKGFDHTLVVYDPHA